MSAKLSRCCNAPIGWDAWVDSEGEVCGGPYDASQCMECGESDPEHAEPQSHDDGGDDDKPMPAPKFTGRNI